MKKLQKNTKQKITEHPFIVGLNQKEYKTLLNELKNKIRSARLKAALAVNRELITLYWHIGQQIVERDLYQRLNIG